MRPHRLGEFVVIEGEHAQQVAARKHTDEMSDVVNHDQPPRLCVNEPARGASGAKSCTGLVMTSPTVCAAVLRQRVAPGE